VQCPAAFRVVELDLRACVRACVTQWPHRGLVLRFCHLRRTQDLGLRDQGLCVCNRTVTSCIMSFVSLKLMGWNFGMFARKCRFFSFLFHPHCSAWEHGDQIQHFLSKFLSCLSLNLVCPQGWPDNVWIAPLHSQACAPVYCRKALSVQYCLERDSMHTHARARATGEEQPEPHPA